jgi:hypothetical protein
MKRPPASPYLLDEQLPRRERGRLPAWMRIKRYVAAPILFIGRGSHGPFLRN